MRTQVLLASALFCVGTQLFDPTGSLVALVFRSGISQWISVNVILWFHSLLLSYPLASYLIRTLKSTPPVAATGYGLHIAGWFMILTGNTVFLRSSGTALACEK
eukprot:Blabericola_migrator_1__5017@NODE_2602_length_2552_cov_213_241449_g1632_i0_p5_GENE_NODE_2602_length_2552_cov_213_241449_g1632_i0NODE_2602_length_2552_cov_213_241449_g1632_i0_p5_ORF_typecomplete_len104_score11_79Phage_holin_2_2/PF10746_9/5_3e03Phage_holin_2_2/PF10746_9/0_12TruB_C/PF09142_11/0_33_NODE_2602_length_2552_cov_213_241449_g1632_i08091120